MFCCRALAQRFLPQEFLFKGFKATLYEPRWRAVLAFMQKLQPLLPVLAATYSAEKFKAGVDFQASIAQRSMPRKRRPSSGKA